MYNLMNNTQIRLVKKSYSQCGEDLIVSFLLRHVLQRKMINYIDIGCNHPYRFNNTFLLKKMFKVGKGVLVEPNPELHNLIKAKRGGEVLVKGGVGTQNDTLKFFMFNVDTLNTFSETEAKVAQNKGYNIEKILDIEVVEINSLLKKHFTDGKLDFLSIDTEGHEFEVLQAIDYETIRPSVLCVETSEFGGGKGDEIFELIEFFKEKEYILYADTWINTIFVDKRLMGEKRTRNTLFN